MSLLGSPHVYPNMNMCAQCVDAIVWILAGMYPNEVPHSNLILWMLAHTSPPLRLQSIDSKLLSWRVEVVVVMVLVGGGGKGYSRFTSCLLCRGKPVS